INDSQFVKGRRWGLPELSLICGLVLIAVAVAWTFIQRSDGIGERLQELLPGTGAPEISGAVEPAVPAAGDTVAAAPAEPQTM
ncbi:MAG: hypothetical protein GWN71_33675, partial [Gammaproteobacteria bacterium]|nr:hypothetical protein [Gammaproteobacteria bacterium]